MIVGLTLFYTYLSSLNFENNPPAIRSQTLLTFETMMTKSLLLSALMTSMIPLAAQAKNIADSASVNGGNNLHAQISAIATAGSGDFTPFWLMNGQFGKISPDPTNSYIATTIIRSIQKDKKFSWGAGMELGITAGLHNKGLENRIFPQQLYGELKYRSLRISAGTREINGWVVDPKLSSGNPLYGNNSRPIPQIRAGIPEYTNMWGSDGMVQVKGYIAYGAWTDNKWVRNWVVPDSTYAQGTLYHSKGGMMKIGKPDRFPLEFEWGLETATQFGGVSYNNTSLRTKEPVRMPCGLRAWISAFFPLPGDPNTPLTEQVNKEGNILGNWNFAFTFHGKDGMTAKLYYLHFFEDDSMLFFDYPWKDGMYGIELNLPSSRWISKIVGEYIYTKDQASSVYWDISDLIPEQVSGRDSYYYHYIYNGWQNYGMTIGNPLIISPVYNMEHVFKFQSNRIFAYHLGVSGNPFQEWSYRLKTTFQKSWGTYHQPFDETRQDFSLLSEVEYSPARLGSWKFGLAAAIDRGSLIGNNSAVSLKITKTLSK